MSPKAVLLAEQAGHVLTVTINRPEKKNAVNAEVLCGLSDAWHRLDDDDDLRLAEALLKQRGTPGPHAAQRVHATVESW